MKATAILQVFRAALWFGIFSRGDAYTFDHGDDTFDQGDDSYEDASTPAHNATRMEEICVPRGYSLDQIYSSDYDRSWSTSSSYNSILTQDPACDSKRSNPRYYYTSHLLPCNFTFHKLSVEEIKKTGPNELTDLCSSKNQIEELNGAIIDALQDYVHNWPDECVADQQRCYSVEDNQDIFAKVFCEKHWVIPNEVTHIGVDCSADKQLKLQKIAESDPTGSHTESEPTNLTKTQAMCARNGFDVHITYDTSFSRYWSFSESYAKSIKYDPACESARSNMRDFYTSSFSPCDFTFHAISEGAEGAVGANELSTACSKQNLYRGDGTSTAIQDYVYNWPDRCVGDFQRCYSVEKHEAVYSSLFCKKHWEIPEGVTHIGVDCTKDRREELEALMKAYPDDFEESEEDETITGTQRMCSRLGYDLDRLHDTSSSSRNWWPGDNLSFLKNNQPCSSRKSNARSNYTAQVRPCNFTFHQIPEGADDTGAMELSDMCSSSNEHKSTVNSILEDYVYDWPDECVGDFQRCYHIEKHEKIFADLFCKKHWTIPVGATHIGVDCSADKQSKIEQIQDYLEQKKEEKSVTGTSSNGGNGDDKLEDKLNYFAHQEQELHEVEAMATAGVLFIALFCAMSMFCTYKAVLKPWLFRETEKSERTWDSSSSLTEGSFEMNTLVDEGGSPERANPPRLSFPTSVPNRTATPKGESLKYRLLEKA